MFSFHPGLAALVAAGLVHAAPPVAPADSTAVSDPADADAAAPALGHPRLDSSPPVDAAAQDWRLANDRVGQFRRGHLDLLEWEMANPEPAGSAPARPQASGASR